MTRKTYTEEQKQSVVTQASEIGVHAASQETGISRQTIARWIKESENCELLDSLEDEPKTVDTQEGIIINIYLMGETENAEKHIRRIRDDLYGAVSDTIRESDYEALFYPVYFHVTPFNLGWHTNHIIMIRPESKTGKAITSEYFTEMFRKTCQFARNKNYKSPIVISVYADTLPLAMKDIEACVKAVLEDHDHIYGAVISDDEHMQDEITECFSGTF